MQLMGVASSNIHAVGYDPETNEMQVQFNDGTVYSYQNVSPDVYANMIQGDIGRYFASIVKPQRYTMPYTKLGVMPLV